MRKRIFEIIEAARRNDKASAVYDYVMIVFIVLSLIPLAFREEPGFFVVMDKVSAAIFILDYFLRWFTADYKFKSHTAWSFLRYPFSVMAIIDLLSILPSLTVINRGFKVLRVLRMLRALRVVRVLKIMRYSRWIRIIGLVLRRSRDSLLVVVGIAVAYVLISALIMFNIEPESFDTYFNAVYWATMSLTTVGYGDFYPVTAMGRVITMISSLFGIAVVALPSGIITASFMSVVARVQKDPELDTDEIRRFL